MNKAWALRLSEQDLAEIKARAQQAGLTASEYVRRCALGTIDVEESALERRLSDHEQRLERLERVFEQHGY